MGKDGEFGGSVFFAQVENGRNLCNFFRPPLSNTMNTRQQNELFPQKNPSFHLTLSKKAILLQCNIKLIH